MNAQTEVLMLTGSFMAVGALTFTFVLLVIFIDLHYAKKQLAKNKGRNER